MSHSKDGWIMVHTQLNPLGELESITYSWEGGQIVSVSALRLFGSGISVPSLKVGSVFSLGPWRLRVVEVEPYGILWVMRDGWRSRLRALRNPISQRLDLVYRRFVLTAAVWGMARFRMGALPTWRDVYLLDRIANKTVNAWKARA